MVQPAHVHQHLPAGECYFAVLDGSRLPRSLFSPVRALGYLFEAVLPVPLSEIHAVYLLIGHRRYLACGVDRSRLEKALPEGVRTLTPAEVPPFLEESVDPSGLNLLVREFEPPAVSKIRQKRRRAALATCVAVVALLLIGLERRRLIARERVVSMGNQQHILLDRVFGPAERGVHAAQRRARLLGELRMLRRTRTTGDQKESGSVGSTLGTLLRLWPEEELLWIESLNVSESAITIRGKAATATVAQRLTDHVKTLPGWRVDQPQFAQSNVGVQFTVRLKTPQLLGRPGGRS